MAEELDAYAEARRSLLEEIAAEARETATWTGRPRFSDGVMAALARVPRHAFVPEEERDFAYLNRPLPIGHGQTISQPYIVAVMTDLLDLEPQDRVLEIGTGCGYQTAVLAELAAAVYSIEVVADLAEAAKRRLGALGHANVFVRVGDGFKGWPEEAPFDAVIVTAAPLEIPEALIAQLKEGGRMVVPIGEPHVGQSLYIGVRRADGGLEVKKTLPVAFVPMVPGRS